MYLSILIETHLVCYAYTFTAMLEDSRMNKVESVCARSVRRDECRQPSTDFMTKLMVDFDHVFSAKGQDCFLIVV